MYSEARDLSPHLSFLYCTVSHCVFGVFSVMGFSGLHITICLFLTVLQKCNGCRVKSKLNSCNARALKLLILSNVPAMAFLRQAEK